ncbi:MAG: nucleotide exchange factor GrpE [Bacteroidales bacterium]|nr:nucleotide exchange factor GrpE [Bacteroidales bacterium]MCF8404783.1 nucleotide exchange factor GrpE [Bacteroidales bacterium]
MAKKKSKPNKEKLGNQEDIKTEKAENQTPEKENQKHEAEKAKSKEEELQEKLDEINDKYIRLYSEFDNYRRRTASERIELSKTASEGVITELLPVIDDFERAIKSSEEVKDCDAVKEGIQLIYNKMSAILKKKGLVAIEAIGKEFDTDFHEAITYIPASSKKMKDKIVDEIEKGYLLGDKVIRYTKVIIGK